ncbi:hypothetical protein TNIN_241971 [Trichonephila inaurata madagascariensis]|uniref:Uncharacterized protein n=1 Tax=Trichonephila inaurata madagascariensis TaxID=2747483 RepID=A0A8X7CKJ3_9ARAC|nr:hypothetical protein TNIN_241971 [Trichonephila inaurata madagascariensis]
MAKCLWYRTTAPFVKRFGFSPCGIGEILYALEGSWNFTHKERMAKLVIKFREMQTESHQQLEKPEKYGLSKHQQQRQKQNVLENRTKKQRRNTSTKQKIYEDMNIDLRMEGWLWHLTFAPRIRGSGVLRKKDH